MFAQVHSFRSFRESAIGDQIGFWLLVSLLFGGMATDAVSVYLKFFEIEFWRISMIFRGTLAISIVCWIVLFSKIKIHGHYYLLLAGAGIALSALWLGYLFDPLTNSSSYINSSIIISKILYFFLLYYFVCCFFDRSESAAFVFRMVDWILIAYVSFVIIGLITGSEPLRTYWNLWRPGYKGIIIARNEATGFFLVVLAWYLIRTHYKSIKLYWLIIAIFSSIILGTKGILAGMSIFLCVILIISSDRKKTALYTSILLISILVIATFLISFIEPFRKGIELYGNTLQHHYHNYYGESLLSTLLSGRDIKAIAAVTLAWDQVPWSFLLGGFPISQRQSEIDPIDISILMGIPFLCLLMFAYWRIFFRGMTIQSWGTHVVIAFFTAWMLVAVTGGHMWYSPVSAPYIVLMIYHVRKGKINVLVEWSAPIRSLRVVAVIVAVTLNIVAIWMTVTPFTQINTVTAKKMYHWEKNAYYTYIHSKYWPFVIYHDETKQQLKSTILVLEDGTRLGPGSTNNFQIAAKGMGRYSHWKAAQVVFSSTDNTSPITNGRKYEIRTIIVVRNHILVSTGLIMLIVLILNVISIKDVAMALHLMYNTRRP